MSGVKPSRKTDEMVLHWLRLRCGGLTTAEIAYRYSTTAERVRVATNRVVKADIAHSGKDAIRSYWSEAAA